MAVTFFQLVIEDVDIKTQTLTVWVCQTHYSGWYFGNPYPKLPDDASFFLQSLWKEDNVFGQDITLEQLCDESWIWDNTFRFIRDFQLISSTNATREGYEACSRLEYNGEDIPSDKYVEAIYEVQLTEERYVSAFSEGEDFTSRGDGSNRSRKVFFHEGHLSMCPDLSSPVFAASFTDNAEYGVLSRVVFSLDSKILFVVNWDGVLSAYDTETWESLYQIKLSTSTPEVLFDLQGQRFEEINEASEITTWNFQGKRIEEQILPMFTTSHSSFEEQLRESVEYALNDEYDSYESDPESAENEEYQSLKRIKQVLDAHSTLPQIGSPHFENSLRELFTHKDDFAYVYENVHIPYDELHLRAIQLY